MNLIVSHIRKEYGEKAILSDCSASFDSLGTYVLMGPNGCGKSTFLRICALIENQDGGEILFSDGKSPLRHDLSLRQRITLVLARIGVFNTTVYKNVAYGLVIRGIHHREIDKKVSTSLAFVGLEHKKNQRALTLSSGETQRLGIARALAIEPEILFLDEPTASVDQENTEIIESIIRTMKNSGRTTVIMTTHDREQAERLADVLLFMKEGTISRP
ncbi:MAG TPA: ATP-binding cassette domain-containing protein [Nitrospirota bacterium]|nr:ATP-binding cassette domain-containing protein [Nitrospirota bacterium]